MMYTERLREVLINLKFNILSLTSWFGCYIAIRRRSHFSRHQLAWQAIAVDIVASLIEIAILHPRS